MSALSEIDIRDFQRINVDLLETQLCQDDYNQMLLFDFKEYCDILRNMQKKLSKPTAALFKAPEKPND